MKGIKTWQDSASVIVDLNDPKEQKPKNAKTKVSEVKPKQQFYTHDHKSKESLEIHSITDFDRVI